jgi:hypothetical protein
MMREVKNQAAQNASFWFEGKHNGNEGDMYTGDE